MVAALAVPLVPARRRRDRCASHALASALTGGVEAQHHAAELLPWLVPAAAAQVYAGVAASALGALDDYATAALGFARRRASPASS